MKVGTEKKRYEWLSLILGQPSDWILTEEGLTLPLRVNVTEQTSAPPWAFTKVFTHLFETASQILILPSRLPEAYTLQSGEYLKYIYKNQLY